MIQDLGKKLEARLHKLGEKLNREIEDLKIKQAEIQNSINWKKKSSLEGANGRLQEAEEQISEVEDRLVEITDVEKNKGKRMKRNEESLRELLDNLKCTNSKNM